MRLEHGTNISWTSLLVHTPIWILQTGILQSLSTFPFSSFMFLSDFSTIMPTFQDPDFTL